MNYEEILLNYAKYFQQSDVVESAIRTVGWKLILLLRGICDACQSVWEPIIPFGMQFFWLPFWLLEPYFYTLSADPRF